MLVQGATGGTIYFQTISFPIGIPQPIHKGKVWFVFFKFNAFRAEPVLGKIKQYLDFDHNSSTLGQRRFLKNVHRRKRWAVLHSQCVVAGVLSAQGVRASAAMILTTTAFVLWGIFQFTLFVALLGNAQGHHWLQYFYVHYQTII